MPVGSRARPRVACPTGGERLPGAALPVSLRHCTGTLGAAAVKRCVKKKNKTRTWRSGGSGARGFSMMAAYGCTIWVPQDRPAIERAARNFCFGLKRIFKQKRGIPYSVHISDVAPYKVHVGGELALTSHIGDNEVQYEWHGEWRTWDDLHNRHELKELAEKMR